MISILTFTILSTFAAQAPIAAQKEYKMEKHGAGRTDEYFWLKDRKNPEVIKYLNAENTYLNTTLKKTEKLQKTLFKEMKSRIKDNDNVRRT